jgi:hypothetical protein
MKERTIEKRGVKGVMNVPGKTMFLLPFVSISGNPFFCCLNLTTTIEVFVAAIQSSSI